ncbi:PIN/TRAM domain-containing protein [Apilactobacillus xinyiensis]|uniref:PIN/TRAM domain-containing protein n=1 Tax=Apilactobacillus xinyiensis TaxID=2841032 RepID=UPI001C7D2103|nr:PIN domain-containing protein [Apilactobacillus xinyiensis]MCL0330329.1 PIN domain nuclease [Apilactobacillus xinyiensis]
MKSLNRTRIIQSILTIIGGAIGIVYLPDLWFVVNFYNVKFLNNIFTDFILGCLIFLGLSFLLTNQIKNMLDRTEKYLSRKSPLYLLMGVIGMILGLVLAILVSIVLFRSQTFLINTIIPIVLMLFLGYFGFILGTTRINDWGKLFHFSIKRNNASSSSNVKNNNYKILDTNILIDGRIYDLVKTGFLEGTLVVPNFVLYELQYIADSSDSVKRVRGRRGLDILNKLQSEKIMPIEMYDKDYKQISEVDSKLIQLAKDINGVIVTNDYNLNKVISFQKVNVLNINVLSNALKQKVLPGESMQVTVVKKGTERRQGVAYLDDGTMVVVEEGRDHMNQLLNVTVTSALQTDAGKMIFAKIDK